MEMTNPAPLPPHNQLADPPKLDGPTSNFSTTTAAPVPANQSSVVFSATFILLIIAAMLLIVVFGLSVSSIRSDDWGSCVIVRCGLFRCCVDNICADIDEIGQVDTAYYHQGLLNAARAFTILTIVFSGLAFVLTGIICLLLVNRAAANTTKSTLMILIVGVTLTVASAIIAFSTFLRFWDDLTAPTRVVSSLRICELYISFRKMVAAFAIAVGAWVLVLVAFHFRPSDQPSGKDPYGVPQALPNGGIVYQPYATPSVGPAVVTEMPQDMPTGHQGPTPSATPNNVIFT